MFGLFAPTRRHARWRLLLSLLSLTCLATIVYLNTHLSHVFTETLSFLKPPKPDPYATYPDHSRPIFPPIRKDDQSSEADLCANFPPQWLERVQVVFKTGVAQSEHSAAHLSTVTSCFPNLLVFSDAPEQNHGHDFIDVLADLPPAYFEHPDMELYHAQREKTSLAGAANLEPSTGGWKLDRFKFLPMVRRAYNMRPNVEWYVFLEADVYMFWDNLFRLLEQFDGFHDSHYLGSAVAGAHGKWFAYGGAGFVLSQALMREMVGDGTVLSQTYQRLALEDCCGDAVLGYAILDKTGVKLEDLYPMFSGERIEDLAVTRQRWCTPLISLHHVSPDELRGLWRWERTRRTEAKRPLTFSDLLEYRQPTLREIPLIDFWDNLSPELLRDGAESQSDSDSSPARFDSVEACAAACEKDSTCLQYSYRTNNKECRLSQAVIQGHKVDEEMISGWNWDRIAGLGACKAGARWKKAMIHRCGIRSCA